MISKVSGDKNRKSSRSIQLKQTSNSKNFLEIVILMFHEVYSQFSAAVGVICKLFALKRDFILFNDLYTVI